MKLSNKRKQCIKCEIHKPLNYFKSSKRTICVSCSPKDKGKKISPLKIKLVTTVY